VKPCGFDHSDPLTDPGKPTVSGTVLKGDSCDLWDRIGQREDSAAAWREGFADFVAHVTMDSVPLSALKNKYEVGCSTKDFDDNGSAYGQFTSGSDHVELIATIRSTTPWTRSRRP
jgi:hypothetical protein